jgi:fucose permease
MSAPRKSAPVVPGSMLVPFILVTILFPLWGFANDITNPMVAAFKNILLLTNFESSLVQAAFYGGYALMAVPAAIFIKRFSYKKGILLGLTLYALGCLLFIPSGWSLTFAPFLLAYLIMTCGLSFLETTANPYILSMGDESTATRRLNLAQAFNPMGSIIGMFVASMVILTNLDGTTENGRRAMKAASEGKPIHTQLAEAALKDATELEALAKSSDFTTSMRQMKKAMEKSQSLSRAVALLADPKPGIASEVSEAIAAQPVPDRFGAAAQAVAVVLRLREKTPPTPAEARRDEVFRDAAGLELAQMLGKELPVLSATPAFGEAVAALAATSVKAGDLEGEFKSFYESKAADSAKLAALSTRIAEVRAAAESSLAKFSEIPAAALGNYPGDSAKSFTAIQKSDLDTVVGPYAVMGLFLLVVLALFAWKLPHDIADEGDNRLHLAATFGRLIRNGHYLWGVIAQTFYVGAQIMCWTFIIQYAELELGVSKSTAQNCNILAMLIFVSSRFICTFILHYVKPGALLACLAVGGLALTLGTVFIHGYTGLYCLIGVSACMSLMFPTIYGIALEGLGDDAKIASCGLILAIGGGCVMPSIQGAIIDLPPVNLGFVELASVRASFLLPALCFAVIAFYGIRVSRTAQRSAA